MDTVKISIQASKDVGFKRIPDESIIQNFLYDQDISQSSRNTLSKSLTRFFNWLVLNKINFQECKRRDIISYKSYLFDEGLSTNTVKSYLSAVRTFYVWAEIEEFCVNTAKNIKSPKNKKGFLKKHLTKDKVVEILSVIEQENLRNRIIIKLMIFTGLRGIEVERLDCSDIQKIDGKNVLMIHGKGRQTKDDFVPLADEIYNMLVTFTKNRFGSIFTSKSPNSRGKRLSKDSISKVIKNVFKKVGLDSKYYTAHSVRHTIAVLGLDNGLSIYEIQRMLRHEDIRTTQIYAESGAMNFKLNNQAPQFLYNLVN